MRSLAIAFLVVLASCGGGGPDLDFGPGTPDDLRRLAMATLHDFLTTFPAQQGCIGIVGITGDRDLRDRARYDPDTARITLRIPATAAKLRNSLIHELAHHLESVCPDQGAMRSGFLRAQGLAEGSSWFDGPSWEETPSEQFAEAVVEVVEGRRNLTYGIELTEAAVATVADWGAGRVRHRPSTP